MTLRKDFSDKLVPISEKNSGITVETLNKLNRLCSKLIKAGTDGCSREDLKKELGVASINTVDKYLKDLASLLKYIFPDDYETFGIEQTREGRGNIFRFRSPLLVLNKLGGQSFNRCLVSKSLNLSSGHDLESFKSEPTYSRHLHNFSLTDEDYLKLSHSIAVEIALNDLYIDPLPFYYYEEDYFSEITSILETAGRLVHYRQLCSLAFKDSKLNLSENSDYFVPLALVRADDSIQIPELKVFKAGTIVLLGLNVGSRDDSAFRQSLEGSLQYSVFSSDIKNNLKSIDIEAVTNISPLKKGSKRITYTLAEDAGTDAFFSDNNGDLLNLQGLPFEIEVYDNMLDIEERLYPNRPNTWMVDFEPKTSDMKFMDFLKEISEYETDEFGNFTVPEGCEDIFINPCRVVLCINYLSLMELMRLYPYAQEAAKLPAFMSERFKRQTLSYFNANLKQRNNKE